MTGSLREFVAGAALLFMVSACVADGLELDWFTIADGGGTFTGSGGLQLSATTGDAGASGPISGNGFELTSGFWAIESGEEPPCGDDVRGDANCDGGVDFDDIDCFVAALIGEGSWSACGGEPGCDYTCVNDINQDGSVDFDDIDKFVDCLIDGGCD